MGKASTPIGVLGHPGGDDLMDCLVSAVAARIVLIEGSDVTFIEADQPTIQKPATLSEIPLLLADAYDVVTLKNTDTTRAFAHLLHTWNCDRALRMLDILLAEDRADSETHDATKYLSDFLLNPSIRAWLLNRAFALPIASAINFQSLDQALKSFPAARDFVSHLVSHQNDIRRVRTAWESIPNVLFGDANYRTKFEFRAVSCGAFFRLSESLGTAAINNAVFHCYSELRDLPNSRAIVREWTKPFTERLARPPKETLQERDDYHPNEFEPTIVESGPIHKTYTAARKQQEAIIQQLERGNTTLARRFTSQLVEWQLQNGGAGYAAMSLCLLAQEAKRLHFSSLQLEWARRATELAPDDARAHGQAGDAYLSFCRLNEAMAEFSISKSLIEEPFGATGIARIFRIRGRLDDALRMCIEIKQRYSDHPEIPRTWALQCEILRDMWRFEESLAAYQEARSKFPGLGVFWCGTAAVLKDMGRLSEALTSYADAATRFPDDPVARGGYADTLKTLGELDRALSEYESAIPHFQNEPVLVCGRADVLRTMGRFHDAAACYRAAMSRFPFDPAVYCGYADTQRDAGNIIEALSAYDEAIAKFPDDLRCRTGRASVLRFAGRFDEALQALDASARDFPYDLYCLAGRANLLKLLGRNEDALNAYEVVIRRRPDYAPAKYGKAAVHVLMKEFDEADRMLPTREAKTSVEWVGLHIRGMMYLKRGELDKAIEVLSRGSVQNPFYRERQFFQTALAAAKIRRRQFSEAVELLNRVDSAISQVLMMHSLAELGQSKLAEVAYSAVNDNASPNVTSLKNAVAGHFGLKKTGNVYTEEWILNEEVEVLLQAA